MAPRSPALPIANVLASALLAAVAMYTVAPVSCAQPGHPGPLHPVHVFLDRAGARLERSYPQLMQWSPARWVSPRRIDCRCTQPVAPAAPAPAAAALRWPGPLRQAAQALPWAG